MIRYINLDFDKFAPKYLSEQELKKLEGLEIHLCLDPGCKQIYHEVCACKKESLEAIREEDKLINSFVEKLQKDEEVLALALV